MSSSTPVQPSLTTIDAREWLLVLAAAIVLKLLCWQIDPTMRTFVGDSATYLWAALSNQPPPDRSFTYPLIIRATALAQGNLALLGCLQSAIGALLCTLVYRCLRRDISASRSVATVLALLLAIEPGQLFYERMVMTETFGTLQMLGFDQRGKQSEAHATAGMGVVAALQGIGLAVVPVFVERVQHQCGGDRKNQMRDPAQPSRPITK